MLLIIDLVLVALIVFALWLAAWRGRARARRAARRAPRSGAVDLIPGRAVPVTDRRPRPRAVDPALSRTSWSASAERGETATLPVEPTGRPVVFVEPRGSSWVVRRDGASRVSSVHTTREAAEARARKTARRERVVLEIRDTDAAVIDRTDFSAAGSATVHADGATAPRS